MFTTALLAEDALIDLWRKNEYPAGQAPIAVYPCEDCGNFHLTSRPPMNTRLAETIASKKFQVEKEGYRWENRLKRKS